MAFFKKLGGSVQRLFGAHGAKVFEPSNKPRKTVFDTDRQIKEIQNRWNEFTEKVRTGVKDEWRKVQEDTDSPVAIAEDRGNYPTAAKVLDTVQEQAWIPLISSNVDQIRYGPGDRILQVIFKSGAMYEYYNVEPEIFEGFLHTHSPGQWVWYVLRAYGYAYARIGMGNVVAPPANTRYNETNFAVPQWVEDMQAQAGREPVDPVHPSELIPQETYMSTPAPPGVTGPAAPPFTNEQRPVVRRYPPAR